MTSQSPRIYIYKITFEEVLYYYYGVHKEKKFNEYYMGSPVTHKWAWDFYTPKKQILQFFDYTDEGYCEARELETRLIKPFYSIDKWCLNENSGGKFSLDVVRKIGKTHFENKTGLFSLSKEERSKLSKEIIERHRKNKVGLFAMSREEIINAAKMGGQKSFEMKTGVFSLTQEQKLKINEKLKKEKRGIYSISKEDRTEISRRAGKISGQKSFENKTGVCGRSKEKMSEDGRKGGKISSKKLNTEKWICLVTGYISTSGPLTIYQRKRGIDTINRMKVK